MSSASSDTGRSTSMAPREVPSISQAISSVCHLTLARLKRSKIVYVAAVFALLPLVPLFIVLSSRDSSQAAGDWEHFLGVAAYMQLLVTALLTAPAIAEEIEETTYVYLWSRPIPRWTVLAAKLIVGCTLSALMVGACMVIGGLASGLGASLPSALARSLVGVVLGCVATGCVAASIGTLIPKHPLAVSVSYLLIVDFGVGAMPFSAARLSIIHNVLAIARNRAGQESLASSVLWLLGIATFWTCITLRRLARKDLSAGS